MKAHPFWCVWYSIQLFAHFLRRHACSAVGLISQIADWMDTALLMFDARNAFHVLERVDATELLQQPTAAHYTVWIFNHTIIGAIINFASLCSPFVFCSGFAHLVVLGCVGVVACRDAACSAWTCGHFCTIWELSTRILGGKDTFLESFIMTEFCLYINFVLIETTAI